MTIVNGLVDMMMHFFSTLGIPWKIVEKLTDGLRRNLEEEDPFFPQNVFECFMKVALRW